MMRAILALFSGMFEISRLHFRYDLEKNAHLRATRNIDFEQVIQILSTEDFLGSYPHHDPDRGHQNILVIRYDDYIYYVPYVRDGDILFLKTIIPSRRLRKIFS